jgi:hypothetical protein
MHVEIGTEAAKFLFWKFCFEFLILYLCGESSILTCNTLWISVFHSSMFLEMELMSWYTSSSSTYSQLGYRWQSPSTAMQMKGRWEYNINVWFRFMYSQKWNCATSLSSKQNYNVQSPTFMYLWAIYIFRIVLPILLKPNRMWGGGSTVRKIYCIGAWKLAPILLITH